MTFSIGNTAFNIFSLVCDELNFVTEAWTKIIFNNMELML